MYVSNDEGVQYVTLSRICSLLILPTVLSDSLRPPFPLVVVLSSSSRCSSLSSSRETSFLMKMKIMTRQMSIIRQKRMRDQTTVFLLVSWTVSVPFCT